MCAIRWQRLKSAAIRELITETAHSSYKGKVETYEKYRTFLIVPLK